MTLARDLRDLRRAQRSGAYSPRLPGVAAGASHVGFMAPREWSSRVFGRTFGPPCLRRPSHVDLLAAQGIPARSTLSRPVWAQVAGGRVRQSLVLLFVVLLFAMFFQIPLSRPLTGQSVNQLCRSAWPARSAAAFSRI